MLAILNRPWASRRFKIFRGLNQLQQLKQKVNLRMSGSGTDKTKSGWDLAGPVVILVEPQLGENIGMAARAMGNFALSRLRIVNPRDGWPNIAAQRAAAGADRILDHVELFETVEQAVADCTLLFATTARAHDQAKPVVAPEVAAREIDRKSTRLN